MSDTIAPAGRPLPGTVAAERLRRAAGHLVLLALTRPAAIVAGLAVVAGVWAVTASLTVSPLMTDNNDEAVYLLQADALRAGHLFPPAPEAVAEAFTPWVSAAAGDHFVPKYTPVFPGFLAAAHVVTGNYRSGMALLAAAAVVTCYLLAREVLGSTRQAVLAAGFLLASPMFLVQSATFLNYLFTLTLLMGFAAALLAAARRQSPRLFALAGFVFGAALFTRPYDAVLVGLPFGLWWAVARRRPWRALLPEARWLALGAVIPVAAMLAYFQAATGHPLRSPFLFVDHLDTIGFGPRRMLPDGHITMYTPGMAVLAVIRLAALTSFWTYGGLVLAFLCAAGLRWGRGAAAPWLALVFVTVPVGYAFFWGSYGSTEWGGPWRFGPFYWMGVLAPAAVLGAAGFRRLWCWDRLVAATVAVGMTLVSAYVVTNAFNIHRQFSAERARLLAAPREAIDIARGGDRLLVFVPPLQGPYLLQPFALARNGSLDGPVVWAIDRGLRANREVLAHFPERTPYRVVAKGAHAQGLFTLNFVTSLQRLDRQADGGPPS